MLITELNELASQWEENKQKEQYLAKQTDDIRQKLALKEQEFMQSDGLYKELIADMVGKEQRLSQVKNDRLTYYQGRSVESVLNERTELLSNAEKLLTDQKVITDKLILSGQKMNGQIQQLDSEIKSLEIQISENKERLQLWLKSYNESHEFVLDDALYYEILNLNEQFVIENRHKQEQLRNDLAQANLQMEMKKENLDNHRKKENMPDEEDSVNELNKKKSLLFEDLENKKKVHDTIRMELRMHEDNLTKRGEIQKDIDKQIEICNNWLRVNEIFGSKEGDKFRKLAMGYTLDNLLLYANLHLNEISDRYQIKRSGDTLVLQVIDRYMANEVRSVISLSGGETFIVSLALALGLSSIASNRVHIETLFIDEGFGALDPDTLQLAMAALRGLQHAGRKVGVISHVQEMTEQIATQINVQKKGNGRSIVCVS